jgi:protein arginine kinase activator
LERVPSERTARLRARLRAIEKDLTPLLQRAHEGATHHVGKVPARGGGTGVPAKAIGRSHRLQKELKRAVESEDYERAAKLRDQIKTAENA